MSPNHQKCRQTSSTCESKSCVRSPQQVTGSEVVCRPQRLGMLGILGVSFPRRKLKVAIRWKVLEMHQSVLWRVQCLFDHGLNQRCSLVLAWGPGQRWKHTMEYVLRWKVKFLWRKRTYICALLDNHWIMCSTGNSACQHSSQGVLNQPCCFWIVPPDSHYFNKLFVIFSVEE